MWFLLAAILGSSSLIIILKLFQIKNVNNVVGIMVNYIVAALLSFTFAPKSATISEIVSAPWINFAVLIGVMFMLSFMIFALSAQRSGVAITAISGRAAMALPVIFAFVVLGEQPTFVKIAMLVLLIASLPMIMYKKNDASTSKGSVKWAMLLPVAVFLFNGANDTLVQFTQKTLIPNSLDNPIFMGTMFSMGSITAIIYYFVAYRKKLYKPTGRDFIWGTLLGFINWLCMYGVLNALVTMDGSVFYPLYYTGAIIVATLAGVIAFKEKLTALNYSGILIAIVAIVILAMQ